MKKLLPLLLLFTGMVNAQIVSIPDANFKAFLLSSSPTVQVAQNFSDEWIKIDANNDGEIQQSEAQAVKTLAVTELLVFNAAGLEGFSNLENLRFSTSLVSTLDLTALIHLKTFTGINLQLLTTLNLNNLTNLTELSIFTAIRLTTLNVNSLTGLRKLTCLTTGISNFTVSGLNNLSEILFLNNTSTSFNANALPNLTKLNCSYNQLTTLTISNINGLTELDCSGNQL